MLLAERLHPLYAFMLPHSWAHLPLVSDLGCRWLYSVADDFFTKQLPHNVTWGLTVLYALDASKDLTNLAVQVITALIPP